MMTVDELMTRHPHTLGPENTLKDALALMQDKHIHHIPILDDKGALVGLVSHRDALSASHSILAREPAGQNGNTPLASFMTSKVVSVAPQAGLKEAGHYLQKHQYGCLPVLDDGVLVGIITESDYVQAALTLMEILEEQTPSVAESGDD
ncbi:CBS domain-containing protein [Gallaecimonas sp. GXIMD4217]|uniref:CBS domain-containing protein n=1 Tax=Gallaecimonas sp. GXIMD4217 TaxID=3131927 RepID=UPI00311AFF3C